MSYAFFSAGPARRVVHVDAGGALRWHHEPLVLGRQQKGDVSPASSIPPGHCCAVCWSVPVTSAVRAFAR